MVGMIITYKVNNSRDIVNLNNYLFGRVVIVTRNNIKHYYYYEGILSDIYYYKFCNGCYYINSDIEINNSNINIIRVDINDKVVISDLITAREHFREKYNDKRVRNLG